MKKSIIFILIAIFNSFDGIYTYLTVTTGYAKEANPLMKVIIDINPNLFLCFKLVIVNFLIFLFWKYRERVSGEVVIYTFIPMVLLIIYEQCLLFFMF